MACKGNRIAFYSTGVATFQATRPIYDNCTMLQLQGKEQTFLIFIFASAIPPNTTMDIFIGPSYAVLHDREAIQLREVL